MTVKITAFVAGILLGGALIYFTDAAHPRPGRYLFKSENVKDAVVIWRMDTATGKIDLVSFNTTEKAWRITPVAAPMP